MTIAVLYRWTVKPGMEEQFRQGWVEGTRAIHKHCGSYGARLHKNADGVYVSYARWPDEETRQACSGKVDHSKDGFPEMREATEEFLGEELLPITDDLLDEPQ